MNWDYELLGHAVDQYNGLEEEERTGLEAELDRVVEDHQMGRRPRHSKTEKLEGKDGHFRLKSWPRRALFTIEKRPALDAEGRPVIKDKKPVLAGWIVVYEIERRDKVYKKK